MGDPYSPMDVLRHGDQVQVTGDAQALQAVRERAERTARLYAGGEGGSGAAVAGA